MSTVPETRPGRYRTYQEVLDADGGDVPDHIRVQTEATFPSRRAPIDLYLDREWHDREKEQLWSRVWQFACREEHLPHVGDHVLYEIAGRSYLLVRVGADEIRAYPNACLHRGRQLKDTAGWCEEIRCPFHGFTWNLDGSLKRVPAPWEFPDLDHDEFRLPQVRVETWNGFVFLNPDPDAEPLVAFLGDLVDQFDKWYDHPRQVDVHVSKVIEANWKVAQEAFMECWHVASTHPQTLPYVGVPLCKIDTYRNFARFITPSSVIGPLLPWDPTPEEMLRAALDVRVDEDLAVEIQDGETARDAIIRMTRTQWRGFIGSAIDDWADCEVVDNYTYTVFPNMMPWGGVHKLVYRFRPNGDDHSTCIMDVMLVGPVPPGEEATAAPERRLGVDEPWTAATELGLLGKVFDQDTQNMAYVQRGLESTARPEVLFADHQEDNLRWLHARLREWLEVD